MNVEYTGIDIVQDLLDYAQTKCPSNYNFIKNHTLRLPLETSSADVFCAFSVFTHLLQHETFLYLRDAARCLRPGGRIVFSFIEMCYEPHFSMLVNTANEHADKAMVHLNMFLERNQIAAMAKELRLRVVEFVDGSLATWPSKAPLGQSICFLQKGDE